MCVCVRVRLYLIVVFYAHAERVDKYGEQNALLEPSVVDEELYTLSQQGTAHETINLQATHRVREASFVFTLRPVVVVVVHHQLSVRLPVHLRTKTKGENMNAVQMRKRENTRKT